MQISKSPSFSTDVTQTIKGIAVSMLLFHHLFYQENINVLKNVNVWMLHGCNITLTLATLSKVCIYIFAMLSGYGIAATYKGDYSQFVLRRALKLYSLFIPIFILAQILGPLWGRNLFLYESPYFFIVDMLGLADLFHSTTFNATWWYMSFAILIIFVAPLFLILSQHIKGTFTSLLLALALILTFRMQYEGLFFASFAGVVCKEQNIFEKLQTLKHSKMKVTLLLTLLMASGDCVLQYNSGTFAIVSYAILSFAIMALVYLYLDSIPILSNSLRFLGRHSGNIFMLHTFIFAYFFSAFIYYFKYPCLIFAVLLFCSLLCSVVIELVKTRTPYSAFISHLYQKI